MMRKPTTYVDANASDLAPVRTRLVFGAGLSHGPGFNEYVEYRIGRSACGQFDVLWQKTDWVDEEPRLEAVAWLQRGTLKGKKLSLALLEAVLEAEKRDYNPDGPNFSEVHENQKGILKGNEVWALVDEVFKDSEED